MSLLDQPKRPKTLFFCLLLLNSVPLVAVGVRFSGLIDLEAAFAPMSVPLGLHIAGTMMFCLLGAWQFSLGRIRSRRVAHRWVGHLLLWLGFLAVVSGFWTTVINPLAATDGALADPIRYGVSGVWFVSLVMGMRAAIGRDWSTHALWMARALAIGFGAGTLVWISLPIMLIWGETTGLASDVLAALGYLINLLLVERWARRPPIPQTQLAT